MLTKSLIAAALLATLALVPATEAEAKSNVNLSIGLGVGGYFGPGYDPYGPYYGGGVVIAYDGISCKQARKIVKSEGFYDVNSVDCTAPTYNFTAWRDGDQYKVRVNDAGEITRIRPM